MLFDDRIRRIRGGLFLGVHAHGNLPSLARRTVHHYPGRSAAKTHRLVAFVALVTATLTAFARPSDAAWPSAHGASDNRGFAQVVTLPAAATHGLADVGAVASGTNPVVGTDGTIYIGNINGELVALHPDGSRYWRRKLDTIHGSILSSPVIGADGSIYVVSGQAFRDHRSGSTTFHSDSYLHKFTPFGAWLYWVKFPTHDYPGNTGSGATMAPPNIWQYNGTEAIMVPALYGSDLRLLAFSTNLGVFADQHISQLDATVTGGGPVEGWQAVACAFTWWFDPVTCLPSGFSSPPATPTLFDRRAAWPSPGVAIWAYGGYSPWIWAADGLHDTIAYKFDPGSGFSEIYRYHDNDGRTSSPPVALNVNYVEAVTGNPNGVTFARQNWRVGGLGSVTAAPTLLPNGLLAVIGREGKLSILNGPNVIKQDALNGQSIASAAASCTHLFVASANEFVTYDLNTMLPVARVPWLDGGRHAPVIGPDGHVYAMTEHGIFVFLPPSTQPTSLAGTQCAQGALNPLRRVSGARGGPLHGMNFGTSPLLRR